MHWNNISKSIGGKMRRWGTSGSPSEVLGSSFWKLFRSIRTPSILGTTDASLFYSPNEGTTGVRPSIGRLSRRLFSEAKESGISEEVRPFITFVLGGPGSGKGTQCAKIAEEFGFAHLSAGELLRKQISSGCENGGMILDIIKEGRIVPSDITVDLIRREIELSKCRKILVDGFPRTNENRIAFEQIMGVEPDLVIFFDCSKEEMVKRLLSRNEGRIDDNIMTINKRLEGFDKLDLPVINYYSSKGKLHKIEAVGTAENIFERVYPVFASLRLQEL